MPSHHYSRLHIDIHGLFQSPMSWAHVNREMALALDQLGCHVAVIAHRGFCYDPCFHLDPRFEALRKRPQHQEIDVSFEYPLHYMRLSARFKVGLLVYETTELPPAWVEAIERYLDLLVVPSQFCRQVATTSGVSPERIQVIPYGFNPVIFNPGAWVSLQPDANTDCRWGDLHPQPPCTPGSVAPSPYKVALSHIPAGGVGPPRFTEVLHACPKKRPHKDGFVFLCVAMPHIRKGITDLLEAFSEEFHAEEQVSLVLKVPYVPRGNEKMKGWEIPGLEERIDSCQGGGLSGPGISLIPTVLCPDEMPALYASCDAYVQPSYSEGFGLSILEAKAMGRPTVVTGWGGHMDFCTSFNSFLVEYDMIPAGKAQYDHCSPTARCAQPRKASLREQMRMVYTNQVEKDKKVVQSLRDIKGLTWAKAARRLGDLLLERI